MSYDVLVENLRRAAGDFQSLVAPLAGYDFATVDVSGETFGHVELAAWYTAVADQCDNAGRALHDGAGTLATSLDYAANQYEQTDQGIAQGFAGPLGPLGARP